MSKQTVFYRGMKSNCFPVPPNHVSLLLACAALRLRMKAARASMAGDADTARTCGHRSDGLQSLANAISRDEG